jgi:EAL domain-containing protein (putative c-di-GMP-specific phosphodiesterase class I)
VAAGEGVAELFVAAREIGALAHLERACRNAVIEGSRVLPNRLPLHLNIAIGAATGGVVADAAELAGALLASGRAPDQVVLDLTDAAACDLGFVLDAVAAYRAQGFRVSVDGIRGVVLAQELIAAVVPDVLKLDHSTLGRTVISAAARDEVAQLVAQANMLGILVVGKAIETAEMAGRAAALGVTAGQGRYVGGRPDVAATPALAVSA